MPLTVELPAEIEAFVRAQVADGVAASETAFVAHAVGLYRELKERHSELREHVQQSLSQARNGDTSPLNMDGIITDLRAEITEDGQSR